jgi:hypothetical protein
MGKRSKRGIPEERIEKVGLHGLRRQYGPATGRERGADLDRAAPRAGNASRVTGRERGAGSVGPATDLDRAAPRAGNASRVTGRERGATGRELTGSAARRQHHGPEGQHVGNRPGAWGRS